MSIGENIRKERRSKGFTMKQLAKELEMSEQAISQYERDLRTPNTKLLFKIAKILKVTPEELDPSIKDLMADTINLTSMDNDTLDFLYGNPDLLLLVDIFKRCGYELKEDKSIIHIYRGGENPIAAVPEKDFISLGKEMLEYIQKVSEFEISKLIDIYKFLY